MNRTVALWPLAVVGLLTLLWANFWMWDSDELVLGMPVNLLYHVGICVLASVAMSAVVLLAWPHGLDEDES